MPENASRELEQFDAPPIMPIYHQASPNDVISFGSFKGSLSESREDAGVPRTCEALLRFTPRMSVDLIIPPTSDRSFLQSFLSVIAGFDAENLTLKFEKHGTSIGVLCRSTSESLYSPKREPIQVMPAVDSITRATFHMLNWPKFTGPENYVLRTGQPPLQGFKTCGRFSLEYEGWVITVAATGETNSSVDLLDEAGGFIITHVGSIRRSDGGSFSAKALEDQLALLTYFFAFVLGRWSSPSLVVGFDASGQRVYEEWGTRRCDSGSWSGASSWFDIHHAEFFPFVLPGFYKLWSSEIWHRPLIEALYWYTNANRGGSGLGVDSALLFTQAALELLSWTYCVLDRKMVSENAYKPRGLNAGDKLRLLVSSLGLPLDIPSSLSSLHSKPGRKWIDSMDALTDLRNGLVHPSGSRTVPDGAYYDAWRLSMWYLDLILLRLCGYRGKYANRLSVRYAGDVELIPGG